MGLLSADPSLLDEEVIRIYGERWDIEVFFKMEKDYGSLDSAVQARDFDSIPAHSTIVPISCILLAVQQMEASDDRRIESLFLAGSDEMRDIRLIGALVRILSLVMDTVRELHSTSEQIVLEIVDRTTKSLSGLSG